jgi:sugar/nucleoside kinase (ribokinase family)
MSNSDVLVVGGVGIDTIVRVKQLPLPMVDSLIVPPVREYVGHTGNGVALGSLALGLKTQFIDFIGADREGEFILSRYAKEGLDFHHLICEDGTRRSVNLVDKTGQRLSLYDPRHPPELRMPRDFFLPFLEQARHAHFSIMNWARELYDDAERLHLTVSTDLQDWDGKNDYHRDFAYRSDIVFFSNAAVGERFEQLMDDIISNGKAQIVVVTAGKEGGYIRVHTESSIVHVPAIDIEWSIVDTNGAGDSFVAAFLYGYLNGHSPEECMLLGNIAGTYACRYAGTHERFIGSKELMEHFRTFMHCQ